MVNRDVLFSLARSLRDAGAHYAGLYGQVPRVIGTRFSMSSIDVDRFVEHRKSVESGYEDGK